MSGLMRLALRLAREADRASRREAKVAKRRQAQAQRDYERSVKEATKASTRAEKARLKELQLADAKREVAEFEEEIAELTSLHRSVSDPVDWNEVAATIAPHPPWNLRTGEFRREEERLVRSWQPKDHHDKAVAAAKAEDRATYEAAFAAHSFQNQKIRRLKALASDVLNGKFAGYARAIAETDLFGDLKEFNSRVTVSFASAEIAECSIRTPGIEAIPTESKSVTATGKLSEKQMARVQRHEIYQDHICAGALRAARELFAYLPIDSVIVTVFVPSREVGEAGSTDCPVLSVLVTKQNVGHVHWQKADPSDTVDTFLHRGDFKASRKTGAFQPVTPLTPAVEPIRWGQQRSFRRA